MIRLNVTLPQGKCKLNRQTETTDMLQALNYIVLHGFQVENERHRFSICIRRTHKVTRVQAATWRGQIKHGGNGKGAIPLAVWCCGRLSIWPLPLSQLM